MLVILLLLAQIMGPSHPADQFSVRVRTEGGGIDARVLSGHSPKDRSLSWWNWDTTVRPGNRHSVLFPKARYEYTDLPIELTHVRYSPFLPHNFKVSTCPVGIFRWHAANRSKDKQTVTLMFTWENRQSSAGKFNEYREEKLTEGMMKGILQSRDQFVLAVLESAGLAVSYHTRFNPADDGGSIWQPFAIHGELTNHNDNTPAGAGERIASALAVTFRLEPGKELDVPFVLSWKSQGWAIAREAIQHHREWEQQIDAWQRPILADTRTPQWYKTALLNGLAGLLEPRASDSFAARMLFPEIERKKAGPGTYDQAAQVLSNGKTAEAWKMAETIYRSAHPDALGLWIIQAALEKLPHK